MASKIKLSNANGKIVTIENNDSNMSDVTLNGASITKKVDTLANMRAMNELPETVWCSGYHSKNDGAFGSHFYRLKGLKTTENDNSGTVIIVSVGGSDYVYELQYDGAVNVKWFGAKGDYNYTTGTDNLIAFTQALQSLPRSIDSVNIGGTLFVPAGKYYISTHIELNDDYTKLSIIGENGSEVISPTSVFKLRGFVGVANNYLKNVTIKNMFLRGTIPLLTENTELLEITDCTFVGTIKGISMSEAANTSDIKPKINNNLFYGNHGIYTGETRVADADITHNIFSNCSGLAIRLGYLDGGTVSYNKIFNELDSTIDNIGIVMYKPIWVKCIGNDIFEVNGQGLVILSPKNCTINYNTIVKTGKNNGQSAFTLGQYGAITSVSNEITGNKIVECYGRGINVTYNSGDMTISKNSINGCGYLSLFGVNDSIAIANSPNVSLMYNSVNGLTTSRYWLYLDNSTTKLIGNTNTNTINSDISFLNGSKINQLPFGRTATMTDATLNLATNIDIVFSGVLTASRYINLPSAAVFTNKRITFIKTDSSVYSMILDPLSTQTINGATTKNVNTQYQSVTLVSDGTQWITV